MKDLAVQSFLWVTGLTVFTLGLAAWLTTCVKYHVGETHLKVTLFGICLRRVALSDIEAISRHQVSWGENWWNTLRPFRRVLVIRRRSGLFRNFVITPWHRYVFRAELERAIALCQSSAYQKTEEGELEESESPAASGQKPTGGIQRV